MRIPVHSRRDSSIDSETMTPMIDVVFLLLVFFVCASIGQKRDDLLSASLAEGSTEATTEVTLPDASEWEHQQVRIRLAAPGDSPDSVVVRLNEQPTGGLDDLRGRLQVLAEVDPLSLIILDVDDDVLVQHFVTVYDLCQSLQFRSISVATRPDQSRTSP